MTPALRQAIEILAMPTLDLAAYVANEVNENPFLQGEDDFGEVDSSAVESAAKDASEQMDSDDFDAGDANDFSWDSIYDGDMPAKASVASISEELSWENTASAELGLHDHLSAQLNQVVTDPRERFIGKYLIDAVDDAGYLRLDLAEAAAQLKVSEDELLAVLEIIQTFDPAGIAARNLTECLRLQLAELEQLDEVSVVLLDHLELVARQDFDTLAKKAGCDRAEIAQRVVDLTDLNPKPGLAFGGSRIDAITPDVIVQRGAQGWVVELNSAALPKALVNGAADKFLGKSKQTDGYVKERMNRAEWLIKSLAQRAQTVYKVSSQIIKAQAGFFEYGIEGLVPLTLKQVADSVGVHESTVSRVTTGKYMLTPRGTFELKYFFSSGVASVGGSAGVAAPAVKDLIGKLIKTENPANPLSDDKLVSLLADEGVEIARRTVAKYREALGIASSSGRRIKA